MSPHFENPLIYEVTIKRHRRTLYKEYWCLSSSDISKMILYLLNGGKKPTFFKSHDSVIKHIVKAFIPLSSSNKLISEARPNYFTFSNILALSGTLMLILFGIAAMDQTSSYPRDNFRAIYFLIGVAAIIISVIISRRRPRLDAVPKQSLRTPRREFLIDSWHSSVPNAGKQYERFRDRLYKTVSAKDTSIEINRELHQHLTPRGFEERERLVLTKGQSMLHVHIYQFADDVFVGWESYLNWNRWAESDATSTTVRNGNRIAYRSLTVGLYTPTEFDLIEADMLAETTHRVLVNEIKTFLKECKIEADLDFNIIRRDRAKALTEGHRSK